MNVRAAATIQRMRERERERERERGRERDDTKNERERERERESRSSDDTIEFSYLIGSWIGCDGCRWRCNK
jgi:hypothetical protein